MENTTNFSLIHSTKATVVITENKLIVWLNTNYSVQKICHFLEKEIT